jgi:ComF family protein
MKQLATVWNGLLDVVYPPCCLVCGARLTTGALCELCVSGFVPLTPPFCARCGVPTLADKPLCYPCEAGAEPPFDWSHALGQYRGTLRQAIHRLKYDGKTALARPLGTLLARSLDASSLLMDAFSPEPHKIDLVVPIPLHPARLRERGFNQAERIALYLAQERDWLLDSSSLRRVRRTRTQTALRLAERAANVQGAFAVRDLARFNGKSVLLVDDVLTTTATVKEAARVVRAAGASRVCVVALARG